MDNYSKELRAKIDSCENQDEIRKVIRGELNRIAALAIELSLKDEDYETAAELKKLNDKRNE